MAGWEKDVGALDRGYGTPRVVEVFGIPACDGSVGEGVVELSIEFCRNRDVLS